MLDVAAPGELLMHWVEVVDAQGRTHMEARWTVVPETTAPAHVHAA